MGQGNEMMEKGNEMREKEMDKKGQRKKETQEEGKPMTRN